MLINKAIRNITSIRRLQRGWSKLVEIFIDEQHMNDDSALAVRNKYKKLQKSYLE